MNLFFYYGEESYLLFEQIRSHRKSFCDLYSDLAVEMYSSDDPVETLLSAITTSNMFYPKKLIIYRGLPDIREDFQPRFEKLMKENQLDHEVIMVYEGLPDRRRKLVKFLISIATTKEFKKFDSWDRDKVTDILSKMEKDRGYSISMEVLGQCVDIVGLNLWALRTTLDRIETAVLPSKTITARDVADLAITGEASVFQLMDDFRQRNRKAVFRFLRTLKKPDEAFMVLSSLSKHVRFLLQLKAAGSVSADALAKQLGKSPYYIRKLVPDLKRWTLGELTKFLGALNDLDFQLKSGKISLPVGLELALSEL